MCATSCINVQRMPYVFERSCVHLGISWIFKHLLVSILNKFYISRRSLIYIREVLYILRRSLTDIKEVFLSVLARHILAFDLHGRLITMAS